MYYESGEEGGGGITSVSRLSHFNVLYSRKIWWRIVVWQIGDRTAKFISAKSVCARYRVQGKSRIISH